MRTVILLYMNKQTGFGSRLYQGHPDLPANWREMTVDQISEALGDRWALDTEPRPPSMDSDEMIVCFYLK